MAWHGLQRGFKRVSAFLRLDVRSGVQKWPEFARNLGIDENAPSHGRGVLGDAMPSTIESAGWMSEFFTDQGTLGQLEEGGGVLFV